MSRAVIALLATFLFSCAPAPRVPAYSAQALATCQARGGMIAVVGLSTVPSCLIPYSDAGRACSDSAQCAGLCIARETSFPRVGPGRTVSGQCEAFRPTGAEECAVEVRSGRIAPGCGAEKDPPA